MWPFSDDKVNNDQKANNDGQRDGANDSAFERFGHDAAGRFTHSEEYNEAYETASEFKKGQEAGKDSYWFERMAHEATRGWTSKAYNDGYDNGLRQTGHSVPDRSSSPREREASTEENTDDSDEDSASDDWHYTRDDDSSCNDTKPSYRSSPSSSTDFGDALKGLVLLVVLVGLGYILYSGFQGLAAWLNRPSKSPGDRSGFGYSVSPFNQLKDIRGEVVEEFKKSRNRENAPSPTNSIPAPSQSSSNSFDHGRSYAVVELAPGDFLNVREGPGVNTAAIAQLRSGDGGIQIISAPVFNGATKWAEIRGGGVNGWVNGWVNIDLLKEVRTDESNERIERRVSNPSPSLAPTVDLPQSPVLTINLYCRQCGVTHRMRGPFPQKWNCPHCGHTFDLQKYRYLFR